MYLTEGVCIYAYFFNNNNNNETILFVLFIHYFKLSRMRGMLLQFFFYILEFKILKSKNSFQLNN